jgi:hypothetical protein
MLPQVSPSMLVELLTQLIPAREPALIVGSPGLGKSDVIDQVRQNLNYNMILSHPVVEDPTNVSGLPWPDKGTKTARFLPFGALAQALAATEPTVWVLDDLGQAPAATQASYMQLLLAHRINDHVLPDCVTFVAATNRRTDRAGVSGILEPVKSRFCTIVELVADLDDWCRWAITEGIPVELIAFLRFRPDLLCNFTPSADMVNCPIPRTWAAVGRLLGLGLPDALLARAIAGAVGEGAATEFMAFLKMYRELPTVDAILMDPMALPIPEKSAVKFAVVSALAAKATEKNFDRIVMYGRRLYDASHGEYATLLIKDSVRRTPELQHTEAFIEMASSELGQLIGGAMN